MNTPQRPTPQPDELTAPYWEAAARGELALQYCEACARWQHPPAARCHRCGAGGLGFRATNGRARLSSWTVVRQALAPGFASAVPYINLLVELEEQPGLLLLSDTASRPLPAESLKHGMPMRVYFEELSPGLLLPQFEPEGNTP